MDNIKRLKLPLRLEEDSNDEGLATFFTEYYIRDTDNHYLAEMYDKEIGEEIVWACNQFYEMQQLQRHRKAEGK